MARPANPAALFHLVPRNGLALEALRHPDNRRFVSSARLGGLGLEVGFHVASVPGRVMARLGRDADLILPQPHVSSVHVSLEIHPDTLVVLLSTRSKRASPVTVKAEAETSPADPDEASPPAHAPGPAPAPRPAEAVEGDCVLSYGVNYVVNIAGHHFGLVWKDKDLPSLREQTIQEYNAAMQRQAQGNVRSRFLPTEPGSEAHTWHNTRIHTAKPLPIQETKAAPRVWIGGGQFGSVYRVAEDLNGHAFAVKVIHLHKYPNPEHARAQAHREMKALERLKHKHIIEHLGGAKWDTDDPEVFMPLRLGSLAKFVKDPYRNKAELPDDQLSTAVLEQILSALDYLDWQGMCHRDVKPDNIIYYWLLGEGGEKVYIFQLADFGLANYRQHAQTYCGTGFYIAPEVQDGTFPQSPKMDVWSLFATIADIHPMFKNFPPENAQSYHRDVLPAIRDAALRVPHLAPMVRENPNYRASAAQMLVARFDGRGLTTAKANVPPMPELPVVPPPAPVPAPSAPIRAPARAPPAFPLVKYPPRKPRRLLPPRDAGVGTVNAALRPRGDVGITKGRLRKPSAAWADLVTAPESPAGPSRPLQLQPQLQPVLAISNGGPKLTNFAAAVAAAVAAAPKTGLVTQMPDLVPLSLGPSTPHKVPPQLQQPQSRDDGVTQPADPTPDFVLAGPVVGHTQGRPGHAELSPRYPGRRESPAGKLPSKEKSGARAEPRVASQSGVMPGTFPD